ncbi:MAG: hypothetical protein IPM14_05215 [bacterium]|nr:hypothetical protein [bacterium]
MSNKKLNMKTLDINYFTYSIQDAEYFLYFLAQSHSQNHLYITKENMRFYIRGYVVYEGNDLKFERYQISYLADYCSCNKYYPGDNSDSIETNYRMAG